MAAGAAHTWVEIEIDCTIFFNTGIMTRIFGLLLYRNHNALALCSDQLLFKHGDCIAVCIVRKCYCVAQLVSRCFQISFRLRSFRRI